MINQTLFLTTPDGNNFRVTPSPIENKSLIDGIFVLETENQALAWEFAYNVNRQCWFAIGFRGLNPNLTHEQAQNLGLQLENYYQSIPSSRVS